MFRKIHVDGLLVLWIAIWFPLLKPLLISTTLSQFFAVSSLILITTLLVILSKQRIYLPFATFFFLFLFLIIFAASLYYYSPLQRLVSDSFRYLFFGFFVSIGYSLRVSEGKLENFLQKISLHQIIFSFLVFIPAIYPFLDLFKGRLSSDEIFFHFTRFSGSLGYPTEFGCFLLIPLIHLAHTGNLFSSKSNIFFTVVCSLSILASASRAAILMGAVYLFIYLSIGILKLVMMLRAKYEFLFIFLIVSFFAIAILILLKTQFSQLSILGYILSIFQEIDSSLLHRFKELLLSIKILSGELSVPIGNDRIRPFGLEVLESFLGSIIIRFGWIGFFIFASIIFFYIYQIKKCRIQSIYKSVLLWFLLLYIVVSPFSEVIFRSKGTVIFGILLGICLRGIELKKIRLQNE